MTDETVKFDPNQNQLEAPLYGVSESLLVEITGAIQKNDIAQLESLTEPLHVADIADLISKLESEERRSYLQLIKHRLDPEILTFIEDPIKEEVLEIVGTKGVARAITSLESDDAIHLIEDLDEKQQRAVLRYVPAQDRAMLEEALAYPEDSAGRLMQRHLVCVPTFWKAKEVIDFIREAQDLPENFYDIYVVDPRHHPIGVISCDKLVRHSPSISVGEIMDPDLKTVPVEMDQEEVALLFSHYALLSVPVIDHADRIVGMITVDDIVDVIEEEAEEDIMHLAGVRESDFHAPIVKTSYWRSRWLFVTLISAVIASFVISQFGESIEEKVALSFLMTIVAAMGGNSGMQTVTVTVRALATRELMSANTWKSIAKEMFVGLMNGCIFAVALGGIVYFWQRDLSLSLILGISIICIMLWSGVAGVCMPIIVQRLGMDPAISAGPMLTTTTDILGFAIFLGLATYFLL
ncbi:MAG: magnesium transporter [Pseudomonadota bacterium]